MASEHYLLDQQLQLGSCLDLSAHLLETAPQDGDKDWHKAGCYLMSKLLRDFAVTQASTSRRETSIQT